MVSVKDFQAYSVHISEVVKDSDGSLDNARIVSAAFSPLWYIKIPRHLEADTTLRMLWIKTGLLPTWNCTECYP